MAKDGTSRGGARVGAGKKKKPLHEKLRDGDRNITVLRPKVEYEGADMEGVDIPEPKEYLLAVQKDGKQTCAKEIYDQTWKWLKGLGCQGLIHPQIVEDFAASVGRKVQVDEAITKYGFLGKHQTTGEPVQSPFFKMRSELQREVNQTYNLIWQVVRENCAEAYDAAPMDEMERILRRVK